MIYLSKITLPSDKPEIWPFNIPSINQISELSFDAPITFIAGENGSGKSTLLEALAIKLKLPSVGRASASHDDSLTHLKPFANTISHTFKKQPRSKFFLRSEDFFNFVLSLSRQQSEMNNELKRVSIEYADRSQFAKNQATAAYENSLNQMQQKYGEDLLSEASHGESFLRLFLERIVPNGLYLLDEPEVPLSPLRQLSLLSLLMQMSNEQNCQFIIATHSPILLAYDKAIIYNMDEAPPTTTKWDKLPSVELLKDFINCPERFIKRL
ncbi:MAG: AAA family ATPase [Clostridiales bacterium]|nr:AAA family ATPase [Clostridiales bacterium]